MNGALDEAMEIIKGSLADNSQVEQPYRTTGIIQVDAEGNVSSISIKGIEIDFKIEYEADKYITMETYQDKLGMGYEKTGDGVWVYNTELSSIPWKY